MKPSVPGQEPSDRAARGLNFKSHVPLYIQLTEILKERIESGEWEPGQRFSSEGEIGSEFGVSRTVVRPALAILESDGQLTKLKGRGVFVAPAKVVYRFEGLARSLVQADTRRVGHRIIDITHEDVDKRLAAALGISADPEGVTHIMNVVEIDDQPIAIRDSYISPLISDALLNHLSSGGTPRAPLELPNGLELHSSKVEIEVSSATPFETQELGISAGSPTILVTYRDYGISPAAGIVPIEFARLAYRADITSFRLQF